jgi:hypothetical protein
MISNIKKCIRKFFAFSLRYGSPCLRTDAVGATNRSEYPCELGVPRGEIYCDSTNNLHDHNGHNEG